MNLVQKVKAGDVRAIARFITLIERREHGSIEAIKEIYSQCGRAHLIGITGPPGVGKSCLVTALVKEFRKADKSVGVLAVDPTSPFSGGALLGDRARMIELSSDRKVFIRSLASRGTMGGLSAAVNDAVDIMDVGGKEVILIETVGVGQGDVEIARLAHTVLLVLVPGYGDTLQAMKAGIMEIADVFVINKSDKPGADETMAEISAVQHFQSNRDEEDRWIVPIVKTSALTRAGIDDLASSVSKHFLFLNEKNLLSRKNRERRTRQFLDILTKRIRDEFMEVMKWDPALQRWVKRIGNLELDPYTASDQVIELIREARGQKTGSKVNTGN